MEIFLVAVLMAMRDTRAISLIVEYSVAGSRCGKCLFVELFESIIVPTTRPNYVIKG